jgi:hypothetical protein
MNVEGLIASAYARADVAPLVDESFREGLGVLVEGVNGCDKVTDEGLAIFEEEIIGYLVSRLQVDDYVRSHPEVLARPIVSPVVVLGMPRSGTTLLSYLLAADPNRRSLLRWQLSHPIPPAHPDHLHDDPRVLAMKAAEAKSDADNPFRKKHYEPADGASECTFVQGQDFKSLYWESHLPMPGYSQFMLDCDMDSAYAYHKRFLQVMQGDTPVAWNLKMPSHALHIEALLRTYPDARILWTHRDPFKVTGSLCSLIGTTHTIYMGKPDVDYLASNYPRQLNEHVRRPMAVKDRLGEERIGDVHYAALVADPIPAMREVYAYLGDEFTAEAEQGMRQWLHENPQNKFGEHSYTLGQYNLSVDKLRPLYADYLARFDIEPEA